MPPEENRETKKAIDTLGKLLRTFGDTVGEILDDPAVKEKAKEFAATVVDAAAKVAESRINSEEKRRKIRNVGKAAQTLGRSVETHFMNEPADENP